jgi:hypothetical protein
MSLVTLVEKLMPALVEERRANVLELMKLLDQCASQF